MTQKRNLLLEQLAFLGFQLQSCHSQSIQHLYQSFQRCCEIGSEHQYITHSDQVIPRSTHSISLSKVARVLTSPKGITLNSYGPPWVMQAVFSLSSASISTCQNRAPPRVFRMSSMCGRGYASTLVTWLSVR